jgi:carboxymethylenebutenolidase
MVAELKTAFDQSCVRGEIEMYLEVHHGFAFPSRWCFEKQAAERHWERLLSLYRRQLG